MMQWDDLLMKPPYSLGKEEKSQWVEKRMAYLHHHHYQHCKEYQRISDLLYQGDFEFMPVQLFKEMELKSIAKEDVFKVMTSSGTTGQSTSKIYLDRDTARYQQKVLNKIVSSFIGTTRMPMIILDCPSVLKNREMFSARGAGILGFSLFASDKIYAFDDNMEINISAIEDFLKKHQGKSIFLFGFTFMIWEYLYKSLEKSGITLDFSRGVLIHGGGWKKLEKESISSSEFRKSLKKVCGLERIYDYYGMVEQTGSIFMECECGHLHASIFSDIKIRSPLDFSELPVGEKGIIQVISLIPESYPGHSILTEDEGILLGEDDCKCPRKGKYFKVLGRVKNAEIRGCSDTFEKNR